MKPKRSQTKRSDWHLGGLPERPSSGDRRSSRISMPNTMTMSSWIGSESNMGISKYLFTRSGPGVGQGGTVSPERRRASISWSKPRHTLRKASTLAAKLEMPLARRSPKRWSIPNRLYGASTDANWESPFYQYANRLAHLHFLVEKNQIDAAPCVHVFCECSRRAVALHYWALGRSQEVDGEVSRAGPSCLQRPDCDHRDRRPGNVHLMR